MPAGQAVTRRRYLYGSLGRLTGPSLSLFDSDPAQRLLPVRERLHAHGLAIPECAAIGSDVRVDKRDNPVAGRDESLWLAAPFGPGGPRLCQGGFDAGLPVVGAATGKLCRLRPFDLGVERLQCRGDIASVEGSVSSTEGADGL